MAYLLLQALAFAILSGLVAKNKNRDPLVWTLMGFFFGVFGFIAAVVVSDQESVDGRGSQAASNTGGFHADEYEKKCPDCAERIKLEARVCRYCGREFSDEQVEKHIEKARRANRTH